MSASVVQLSLILAAYLELTSSALVVTPRNTVVVRGRQMELRCQTNDTSNSSALSWKFTSVDGEIQRFIYDEGLDPEYMSRNVTVDMDSSTGAYHLQFQDVELGDAGTYTCQDSAGDGMARAAWVAVLESKPLCIVNVTSDVRTARCELAVNASNIHKSLESLEVRPSITNTSCQLVWSEVAMTTLRRFVVVVNLTDTCSTSTPRLTFNATSLSGRLVSAIDSRPPDYGFTVRTSPHDQGGLMINGSTDHRLMTSFILFSSLLYLLLRL